MVFTGGYPPRQRELDAIRQSGLFAYLVKEDTYEAASTVHDLLVKTHPADRDKIAEIKRLVADHIEVDALLERFGRYELEDDDEPADGRDSGVEALRRELRAGARRLARRGDAVRGR